MKPQTFEKSFLKNKWLILGFLAVVIINFFYLDKVFSIHFVDEEGNLVLGHFLLQGQKLYSDLFSHHQPLAYILSAGFQLITQPDSIHQLIKRHRELMILYSVFWSGVLIWRFKEKIILPLIVYEISKFYLLGQLFLSESLAIYPIFYLTLFLFGKQKPKTREFAIVGLLISFSALLLAPVWPFMALYSLFLYFLKKPNIKQIGFLLAAGIVPILVALPFIDIYYYFRNVFYINFKYYIPQSGEEKFPFNLIKAFLSPVTAVINSSSFSSSGFILKIVSIPFFVSLVYLIVKRKFKFLIIFLTLLTFSNFRYFALGLQYYAGFHLLIWYGLFIMLSFYFFADFLNQLKSKNLRIFLIAGILVCLGVITYSARDLFNKNNMDYDYYVNYSQQFAFGEVIKAMRGPGDTLFVIPDEWLLYFQGDVKNNNRMVNFYGWMSLVWELNDPVVEKFKTDPPTFFYCNCDEKVVLSYSEDYHQMIRDGSKTPLWVLNEKFSTLKEEQKSKLRFFHFQLE